MESSKANVVLPGTVQKVIKSPFPQEPEKAQIVVQGADHLYREIRITNTLVNEEGEKVELKPGAEVQVTVEAPADAVVLKQEQSGDGNGNDQPPSTDIP